MSRGNQLLCVENRDDAFVGAVHDVIAQGGRRLAFFPFNERALRIVAALGPALSNCELGAWDGPENSPLPDGVRRLTACEQVDAVLLLPASAEVLGAALLQLLDMDCGTVIIPRTEWYFKNRPLFLISIPKAGTHLLYELAQAFGYARGIVANSSAVRPGQWYCVEYSNSHTRAPHFFVDSVRHNPFGNRDHPFMRSPAILIYRNPRDVLVSEANYCHKDGNSALAAYWARFSPEERLLRLIDDPWLTGNFRDRMGEFVPWLEMPNVIPVSFEELIGPDGGGDAAVQRRLIWSLQLKLQIPGNPDAFAAQVFNPASPTFFAGKIGAWHHSFSPEVEKRYSALPQDFEAEFGYARSADGSIPVYSTRIDEFRCRKLSFSKADFSSVPIALEYGFFGFNLVSFGGRVYALAESLGAVDLTTMSAGELAGLRNAQTLDEMKYLVALSTLKPVEAVAVPTPATVQDDAAGNPGIAQLVGVHRGFNLVLYGGKVYGLRQSLGEIYLTDGAEMLEQRHGPADFIGGETIGEIRARVDAIEESRGIQNLLLETQKSSQVEMRRDFQLQQTETRETQRVLQADLLAARQTLQAMQESMVTRAAEFEAKLALLNRDVSIGSARMTEELQKTTDYLQRTTDDLNKTKDIVDFQSRMWARLALTWPMRLLLYLSKGK